MDDRATNLAPVRDILIELVGTTVRAARLSALAGSWITVELGPALLSVEMAAWRIETDEVFLLGCEDRRDVIESIIVGLDGRILTAFEVSPFLDLTLDFQGMRLVIFVPGSSDVDGHHWLLQARPQTTLVAGPGHSWQIVGRPGGPVR